MLFEVVVLGEQEDPADGPGGGLPDLIDDRTPGNEVGLPVQDRLAFLILGLPARHAEDRGSSTAPGDVIGV